VSWTDSRELGDGQEGSAGLPTVNPWWVAYERNPANPENREFKPNLRLTRSGP
jgi:hypothetical protein